MPADRAVRRRARSRRPAHRRHIGALPRAARALDADSTDAENHANIATINSGAVLSKLTENFGPDYELVDVSYVNVALYYALEERNRVALRWEHRRMRSALGACPPLFIMQHPHVRIRGVLLPLADVGPRAWVEGRLVHRARMVAPPHGAHIVADLHVDAATMPICPGSHVRRGGPGGVELTVKTLSADKLTATLFYEIRGEEYYLDDVFVDQLGPAIAGYMYGALWAVPLWFCDVFTSLQIAIPVHEFLAIIINFIVIGPRIPTGVHIAVMADSLKSADVLADGTAHAPLMHWLHTRLLGDEQFKRLAALALIGHGFGEANVMGDARSRGYDDLVARLCSAPRCAFGTLRSTRPTRRRTSCWTRCAPSIARASASLTAGGRPTTTAANR